jgi:hypothetical protein
VSGRSAARPRRRVRPCLPDGGGDLDDRVRHASARHDGALTGPDGGDDPGDEVRRGERAGGVVHEDDVDLGREVGQCGRDGGLPTHAPDDDDDRDGQARAVEHGLERRDETGRHGDDEDVHRPRRGEPTRRVHDERNAGERDQGLGQRVAEPAPAARGHQDRGGGHA